MTRKISRKRAQAHAAGYRSGLEQDVANQLQDLGINYKYEDKASRIEYYKKPSKYLPDFILPNGIIVETKGRFLGSDRSKHLRIKKQRPELDIRFVFENAHRKLAKGSDSTYAMWCDKHGFRWADGGQIPDSWLIAP